MPTQVFIIPPKSSSLHKPLGVSNSIEQPDTQSEPQSPISEQTKF